MLQLSVFQLMMGIPVIILVWINTISLLPFKIMFLIGTKIASFYLFKHTKNTKQELLQRVCVKTVSFEVICLFTIPSPSSRRRLDESLKSWLINSPNRVWNTLSIY